MLSNSSEITLDPQVPKVNFELNSMDFILDPQVNFELVIVSESSLVICFPLCAVIKGQVHKSIVFNRVSGLQTWDTNQRYYTNSGAHTNVLFYKYITLMVKDLIDYNICNFM